VYTQNSDSRRKMLDNGICKDANPRDSVLLVRVLQATGVSS